MAIQINGNGTITGISAGGLPAGTVTSATLANSVTTGKILQVKQTALTSVVSRTTSSSDWGNIGLNAPSFTPSSGTKNLIMYSLNVSSNNTTGRIGIRIVRSVGGSETVIPNSTGVVAGNRKGVTSGYRQASTADHAPLNMIIEDTHGLNGSTAVIYKVQSIGESSDTIYLNRSTGDTDVDSYYRSISTITVMEVAA